MESIISNKQECFVCKTTQGLHKHHIFYGTANRKQSEKYGCWCYLCGFHHNMSACGVHFDKTLDICLKELAQRKFEETHTREEFRQIFGKSFILD